MKKRSIRTVPQSPLRKSTRDRRPPERFQQAQTEDSSPSKKNPQRARLGGKPKVQEPETGDQKSHIVRLKLASSVPSEPDSSMSFTDSFSFQQKSADSQNSPVSRVQATVVHTPTGLTSVPDDAIANKDSWRTEPTQPCLPPGNQPAVWAEKRMDLCETLHYFRSYHSSCHSTGGFVRGFMFDKVAGARDYFDSNVVIARASGGQAKDKESGEMRATKDQVEGTVSQNLRNCMSHYNPVVIITGVDNPHMPSQPPHQYCVLDYFKPTHIWSEMSEGKQVVRYRFEKLNAEKQSWWRAKSSEEPIGLGDLEPPVSKPCGTCARESPQIYLNGWMCLHPTCGSFWHILPSGLQSSQGIEPYEPDETALVYDPRFLKSHTPWPNDNHIYPLTSNDATTSPHALPGEDTSEAFTRGVVCQLCGRCVSRLSWTGWACPCGWTKSPPHTLIPALSTREPFWPLSEAYTASRDTHSQLIDVKVSFAHGYRINQYVLPGIDGFVTHMIANESVVQMPGGPDDMFEALQREDIGLKRRPMESSMLKGGLYTRHFCVNYGMPYKFVAATESHAFPADSQHPINAARDLLNWAQEHLLSQAPASQGTDRSLEDLDPVDPTSSQPKPAPSVTPFNELLALGYFASQRISYHDDGESGLGPTIATLSLGAPGIMRLRLKAKHDTGVSKSGIYNDTPPVPGSQSYGSRLALVPKLAKLKKSVSPSVYRERLRQVPKELGLGLRKGGKETKGGLGREALKLVLGHGDVVVMHGEALQRYYEHAVEHEGALRFALTCRWIDPLSVAKGESDTSGVEAEEAGDEE
ncbi:hypothetical protein E8E13_011440 [Curvularia kusanoi]|uniref:Alpha-ketoglutarate-dependent dioxygenase AlkB-like domain-containing protein n=1 Tax=Curvularia kusanoi TaxID=90978 RepID=A0A9P4WEZ5_CURKU|nr:hypothetical protein E8E13_011440 [Curvularia kusanoi]